MITDWMESILSAQWLTDLVYLLMQVIMVIAGIILAPISIIIENVLPDFSNSLSQISIVFDYALQYSSWFISAFAVPPALIGMVVGYYTFSIGATLSVWTIKLALSWFRAFK